MALDTKVQGNPARLQSCRLRLLKNEGHLYAQRTYIVESAHISAIAYCIKLEVDISKRTSFGLKKIGLRGNTIWHEPRKVSEISQKNKARA